jgi:UDP-glucose 4-epimerase
MKIAVSGASGFIGSALCSALVTRGHQVAGLCRRDISEKLLPLGSYQHIHFMLGEPLPQRAINFAPEVFVHLAWDGIPDFSKEMCLVNLINQLQLIKQTERMTFLKKIIGAGSCVEYGLHQGPCMETQKYKPHNFFSWAKQSLCDYFSLLCQERKLSFVWLRIFYVYGPGQRPQSLVPYLINAYKSKKLPDIKKPMAANDYIFLDDVISLFIKSIESTEAHGIYNLGSGVVTTVMQISKIVQGLVEGDTSLHAELTLKIDINNNIGAWADNSIVERDFGWAPEVNLYTGIARMLNSSRYD